MVDIPKPEELIKKIDTTPPSKRWEEIPADVRDWLRDVIVFAIATNLAAAATWDGWTRRRRERQQS